MTTGFRIVTHVSEGSYTRGHTRALVDGDAQIPKIHFKQYIPLDNLEPHEGDVTIIAAHANGIPKECYQPFFDELLSQSRKQGFRIRSIWIADFNNHGQSGLLNADILGNDPCWSDHSRDILHFINMRRNDMPQPIVGIGHSLGASQLVHLALIHPSLLKVLAFMEPGWHPVNPGFKVAGPTLRRKDTWPSREAALEEFRKSPFYGIWDVKCVQLFGKYGLTPTKASSGSEVTLTTSKYQELATLMRPIDNVPEGTEPGNRFDRPECALLFQRLPEVQPPVFYLFGEKSGPWAGSKQEILDTTGTGICGNGGMTKGRVQTDSIKDGTHFMPLEKVPECAGKVAAYLGKELERWRQENAKAQKQWRQKSREEQIGPDQRIVDAVNETRRKAGKL